MNIETEYNLFYALFFRLTVFISRKVVIKRPSIDLRLSSAMDSMSGTIFLMASGMKVRRTSLLKLAWYSPWWKKIACFPNILSLLAGNVGLKSWALFNTNFAASGLEIITHGHPKMWDLNIEPNLKYTRKFEYLC